MARKIYTPEEVQKRLESLPADIQALVYSADMDGVIQKVGTKNQLHIDQLALLEAEVGEVMLGFTESKDFVQNLMDTLQVDRAKADTVAQDINEQLFSKIRESMKNLSRPAAQTPPAAPIVTTKPTIPPAPVAKPAEAHPADLMLTQKTVSVAPVAPKPATPPPPAPQPYKADPYREPTE